MHTIRDKFREFGKRGGPVDVRHLLSPSETPCQNLNALGERKMLVKAKINNIPTKAFIDSGASQNFLSEQFVRRWKIPVRKKRDPYFLQTADGNLIDSQEGMVKYETTDTSMFILGRLERITLDVTNTGDTNLILGLPWLRLHKPHVDWETLTLSLPTNQHPVQASKRTRA
jgi:hypothetical protein